MKNIVISADGDRKVYLVPDVVANDLQKYCNEWIWSSPYGKNIEHVMELCYNEEAFIEYLNTYLFPNEKSVFVKNLGWIDFHSKIPAPYYDYPELNF